MPDPYHPLVHEWKEIAGFVSWSAPDPSDRAMVFVVPLDIDGLTVEGLYLRGRTYERSFDKDVMLQVEFAPPGARSRIPLIRIDWLPRAPTHKNPDQEIIAGSHLHPFHLNWLDQEQRMRQGNLPFARPIPPQVDNFASLLDFTGNEFRISNMSSLPVPEWAKTLFP